MSDPGVLTCVEKEMGLPPYHSSPSGWVGGIVPSQAVLQSMHTCQGRVSPHSVERAASQNPGVYQNSRAVQCVTGRYVHSLISKEVLKASYNVVAAPSTNQRGLQKIIKGNNVCADRQSQFTQRLLLSSHNQAPKAH